MASRLGAAVSKPGCACDVHRLGTDFVDTSADDLSHVGGANPGAPEHVCQHLTQNVGRMSLGQRSVASAHRRTAGLNDDDFFHTFPPQGRPRPALLNVLIDRD